MNKYTKITIIALAITTAVSLGFAIYFYDDANTQKMYQQYSSDRAFAEFTTSIAKIDTAIGKTQYSTTPEYTVSMLTEVITEAQNAKSNLSQLPTGDVDTTSMQEFISKISDYSLSLVRKVSSGQELSQTDIDNITMFSNYASDFSNEIYNIQSLYNDGEIDTYIMPMTTFDNSEVVEASSNVASDGTENEDVDIKTQDFATLQYDGPFSSHIDNLEPKYLEGKTSYTEQEAMQRVADFLQVDVSDVVSYGKLDTQIPVYKFNVYKENDEIFVDMTVSGGVILNYSDYREVFETNLTPTQAIAKAEEILESSGYKDFEETYYTQNDGIITINFAYAQDDVVVYADLIKVSMYLDDGSLAGIEARGYIMSHYERELDEAKVTLAQAKEVVSSKLSILSSRLALIPTDYYSEVLTYEFKCENEAGEHYIVYVDALDGTIENILQLIESENGTLTM